MADSNGASVPIGCVLATIVRFAAILRGCDIDFKDPLHDYVERAGRPFGSLIKSIPLWRNYETC